jgi:lactate permease
MYHQIFDPINHSLGQSTLLAVLPLLTVFVLLGVVRLRSQWAALIGLGVAIIVAVAVYSMPFGQALSAAGEGAAFGLFPIMWIVVNAIWLYSMTVSTGHFDVLRRSFATVSPDQRIQAIIIAFCFGSLLEALAGFGAPVAVASVMLVALGFPKLKAASLALVADTAPVAFGAIAVPITTLAKITNLPEHGLASIVGRQTPLLALLVPLVLVFMVDGRRGIRQTWPAAVVAGLTFAVLQFLCSNYISVPLTDIIASLGSALATVALLRAWQPAELLRAEALSEEELQAHLQAATAAAHAAEFGSGRAGRLAPQDAAPAEGDAGQDAASAGVAGYGQQGVPRAVPHDSGADISRAYAPYLILIVVFSLAQVAAIKAFLAKGSHDFRWPGLHILTPGGKTPSAITFSFGWLPAAGTLLLIAGLLTMLALGVTPARALADYGKTLRQLKWAVLTVAAVLALAYVMNLSGQTVTIGTWMALAGGAFALLSPVLGWLGTAVTGSDTSSNALFGTLQVSAANAAHLPPLLLAAANSSGGVLGKMISPQNLAIATSAVGLEGREGDVLRKIFGWTLAFLAFMCVLVYLQSTSVLSWMLP